MCAENESRKGKKTIYREKSECYTKYNFENTMEQNVFSTNKFKTKNTYSEEKFVCSLDERMRLSASYFLFVFC